MGLFDKLKRNQKQSDFSTWLDKHLSNDLPVGIVAVNINLYEGAEQTYDVELIGCSSFDENDEERVCDEKISAIYFLYFLCNRLRNDRLR